MAKKQLDVNFNQSFLQTVINKVILKFRIPTTVNGRFNNLTFNNLTDLTRLITFFILTLLHNVNKIVMYSLLYIDLLSLRLKNTLVSVGPRTEKLITVSNDHERTHKCNFSFFYWKYLFRANLVKKKTEKNQNCQFELKSGTETNSNMQNSMVLLTFSVFDSFLTLFGQTSYKKSKLSV